MFKPILTIMLTTILLSSCSTRPESIGLGTTIGMSVGVFAGTKSSFPSNRSRHQLQGALIGGALGALIGYLGSKDKPKSIHDQRSSDSSQFKGTDIPEFTSPRVRKLWIPDRIDGNRYIRGHEILIIDESQQWLMQPKKGEK